MKNILHKASPPPLKKTVEIIDFNSYPGPVGKQIVIKEPSTNIFKYKI